MTNIIRSLLLLAVSASVAFAGDAPSEMNKSALQYFELTNEAELLICQDQYAYALEHYDSAFKNHAEPFGKDIYNAWLCAFKMRDVGKFESYSAMLLKRGAFPNDTLTLHILNHTSADPEAVKLFYRNWTAYRSKYKNETDTVYRMQLLSFLERDQAVRDYFVRQCEGGYNICGRDSLNVFDSANMWELRKFIASHGFPTEKRVGYYEGIPYSGFSLMHIELKHDRSWTGRQTMDTVLYQQVLAGKFSPAEYAGYKDQNVYNYQDSLSDYQDAPYSYYNSDNTAMLIDSNLYIFKLKAEAVWKQEEARRLIGMDSLHEFAIKAAYQYAHPGSFTFIINTQCGVYFLDEESIARIKKSTYQDQKEIDALNTIRTRGCKYGLHH